MRFTAFCGGSGSALARCRHAGLFLLEHLDDSFLIMVDELSRVEVGRLALEDVFGQLEHIGLELHTRDVVEISFASLISYG